MGTPLHSRSFLVGIVLTSAIAVLALSPTGCFRPAAPQEPARFLGNAACAECHKHEFQQHEKSRHAISLHTARVSELGDLAPPVGPIGKHGCAIQRDGDLLYLTVPASGQKLRLDLALGSGKTGITFVGVNEDGTVTESRVSYFPKSRQWYVTPGHEYALAEQPGHKHEVSVSRQCLTCHTVTLPQKDLKVERRFFGIGCETCHGPGSAHIDAARRKDKDLRMASMASWSATQINEACGKCHRSSQGVETSGIEITMTNRFQAYGITQSKCFTGTRGNLSCINCHSPHEDLSHNPKDYEAVCLTCHNGAAPTPDQPAENKRCPVNPKEKCITCHMPTRKVFPRSDVPIQMADHLIWAFRKKQGAHGAH